MNYYIYCSTDGKYFLGQGFNAFSIMEFLKLDGFKIQAFELYNKKPKEEDIKRLSEEIKRQKFYIQIQNF